MVLIGGKQLTLEDFNRIIFDKVPVRLDTAAVQKVSANHAFLRQFSSHKLIYGINTGFGPMAQFKVSDNNVLQLQYNLIRSHSSGGGKVFSPMLGKAVMVARLNNLIQAYSGIHPELIELLATLINKDIIPCIFEHGGVGASGDLVQLAHLGLVLIGEGEVLFEGKQQSTAEVFAREGVKPLSIHIREGLAIINGTSAMTGVGLVNLVLAKKLLQWSVLLSSMTNELVA
ncbi:MAG: aromatic amino acid lyase, partial [Chitinophagaceae bacterium]